MPRRIASLGAAYTIVTEELETLADPMVIRARALLHEGRIDLAENEITHFHNKKPQSSITCSLLGEIALRRQRFEEAEAHFLQATTRSPGYLEALHGLGFARYSLMRLDKAIGSVEAMLALNPVNMPARLLRAAIAAQCGDHETALLLYRGIVGERPDLALAWLGLGHSERILGKVDAAITAYRRALQHDPLCGEAWGYIADIKTFTFTPADVRAMQALAARPDLTPQNRIFVEFALGKAFYDAGDDRIAFRHYAAGNALAKQAAPIDTPHDGAWRAHWIERQLNALSALTSPLKRVANEPKPIFIIGLPRSGSTLVEQILGSHPLIEATSELPYISIIAQRLENADSDLSRIDRPTLRSEYLSAAAAHRHTDRPCFIDKMPSNFVHVPLIRMLFPEAAIIDVRRHPLASCVSIFRQHLLNSREYAGPLVDIAKAWRFYASTMSRFDEALPGEVHRLHYEHLIGDTETEIIRLLTYVGVPLNPACLRWYENDQAIRTPSAEQVRQPIFREGLDAWQRFEAELGAAREVLSEDIATYPAI